MLRKSKHCSGEYNKTKQASHSIHNTYHLMEKKKKTTKEGLTDNQVRSRSLETLL